MGKHIDHLYEFYETDLTIEDIVDDEGVTEDNMGSKACKIALWWKKSTDTNYTDTYNSYLRAFREHFKEESE